MFGGVQATGAAVGPILGGFLTSFLTWRVGFGMHVVIMTGAVILGLRIREVRRDETVKLDIVGTILSAVGLALVVLGVLLAGRYGFFEARRPLVIGDTEIDLFGLSPTPFLIMLGLFVLVGLVHWQRRLQHTGRSPLLRVHILRNTGFMTGAGTDAFRQLALAGLLFVVPVYAQQALGFSAIESGLAILPFSAAVFVLSMTTSNLAERIAPKWLILGGLGLFWLGIVVLRGVIDFDMKVTDFILPMLIMGVGVGLFVAQIVNLTISQVDDDERNEGAGTHNTFRELGGALGTAVIGAVFLTTVFAGITDSILQSDGIDAPQAERAQLATALEDDLSKVSPEDGEAWFADLPEDVAVDVIGTVGAAQVDSMKAALAWTAWFVILGVLVATFIPGRRRRDEPAPRGPKPALK